MIGIFDRRAGRFDGIVDHLGERYATAPQLHFEVRDGKEPVDPMLVLAPASTQMASAR